MNETTKDKPEPEIVRSGKKIASKILKLGERQTNRFDELEERVKKLEESDAETAVERGLAEALPLLREALEDAVGMKKPQPNRLSLWGNDMREILRMSKEG